MSQHKVPHKPLGSQGLVCSQQGIGCMGMTAFYGGFDRDAAEEENQRTIAKALELGINHFDTAWIYQSFGYDGKENVTNEELLGRAIKIHGRDKFVIATKFGRLPGSQYNDAREATIRAQIAESLARLGTDYIDLYYLHRMDPNVPIEESVGALKALVHEGKIRYIGLSECTPAELRRAHAVHPITAIQMEWSLQTRNIEAEVVPSARELGVGIVPYSPLGRGFLSGTFTSREQLDEKDRRLTNIPRFSADNFAANVPKASFLDIAAEKGCTPAQLALAWLHAQGEDVFPIPGTKSSARIAENAAAVHVRLTAEEVRRVEAAVDLGQGDRYADMSTTFDRRL